MYCDMPHNFIIWQMIDKFIRSTQFVQFGENIIIDCLLLGFLEHFIPNNSCIVNNGLCLIALDKVASICIPIMAIKGKGKIIPLNPNGLQCDSSKWQPNPRDFAKGQGTFLPQNPTMPVKLSPRSHLSSTNFHHVIDTNVKLRHITLLIGSLAMICGAGNKTCILPLLFLGSPFMTLFRSLWTDNIST